MSTLSVPVRSVKSVHGTVRWLTSDPKVALGEGLPAGLLIRREDERPDSPGTAYMVISDLDEGIVFGYRLEKIDGQEVYDIDADCASCTCPDHIYRQRACKHMRGLRSALIALGLI